MEIKATLNKPYEENQRIDFIIEQNHRKGYEIRETETALEAWGLDENELLERKKEQVRSVRQQYFETYVDFYQSKPLYWEELDEETKQHISDYRQYLKDYTKNENWWEQNPKTYDEWLVAFNPVENE